MKEAELFFCGFFMYWSEYKGKTAHVDDHQLIRNQELRIKNLKHPVKAAPLAALGCSGALKDIRLVHGSYG